MQTAHGQLQSPSKPRRVAIIRHPNSACQHQELRRRPGVARTAAGESGCYRWAVPGARRCAQMNNNDFKVLAKTPRADRSAKPAADEDDEELDYEAKKLIRQQKYLEQQAEARFYGRGFRVKVGKPRQRPSSWRRRAATPHQSIWAEPGVYDQIDKKMTNESLGVELSPSEAQELPFPDAYKLQILDEHSRTGVSGPIWTSTRGKRHRLDYIGVVDCGLGEASSHRVCPEIDFTCATHEDHYLVRADLALL